MKRLHYHPLLASTFYRLPPKAQILIKFLYHNRYWPSFNNPQSFSEKLQVRKLHWKNPLFPICSDKFRVREYVKKKVGEDILVPLLYVGTNLSVDEAVKLNNEYNIVLKASHNSQGPAHLLNKLSPIDKIDMAVKSVNKQLQQSHGWRTQETWYDAIPPSERLILVEKMLLKKGQQIPEDFKFHVFNHVNDQKWILQLEFDRFTYHTRTLYDDDLNILPFSAKYPNQWRTFAIPPNFEEMVNVAKILAADFTYVRVDLYNVDGKVYFGELTFAPSSGFGKFTPRKYDYWMGSLWQGDPRW